MGSGGISKTQFLCSLLFCFLCLVIIKPRISKKSVLRRIMAFFQSAVTTLQTLVVALGAGLGAWGVINLMEGYGNDNPGAKSQGRQLLTKERVKSKHHVYLTTVVATREDVNDYLKHRSEYKKGNRFSEMVIDIYI